MPPPNDQLALNVKVIEQLAKATYDEVFLVFPEAVVASIFGKLTDRDKKLIGLGARFATRWHDVGHC